MKAAYLVANKNIEENLLTSVGIKQGVWVRKQIWFMQNSVALHLAGNDVEWQVDSGPMTTRIAQKSCCGKKAPLADVRWTLLCCTSLLPGTRNSWTADVCKILFSLSWLLLRRKLCFSPKYSFSHTQAGPQCAHTHSLAEDAEPACLKPRAGIQRHFRKIDGSQRMVRGKDTSARTGDAASQGGGPAKRCREQREGQGSRSKVLLLSLRGRIFSSYKVNVKHC